MKQGKKILKVLAISYVIVVAVNLAANYKYYAAGNDWKPSILFSLGVCTFCCLWFGPINHLIFRRWNWYDRPSVRIVGASLIFAGEGVVMMLLMMKAIEQVFHTGRIPASDYVLNSLFAALISMIIGLMITGQRTLQDMKKNIQDTEAMKQEMIQSQYETLKNQVNPHFLFNSLNTLTVMIPQSPPLAVSYVEQMARVFRYSLQHTDDNMVDVATELKVVQAYLFLHQQRFDGKLMVDINISGQAMGRKIITQSLLMLVENAIKHNEISHERPLNIRIYDEAQQLLVENTLQRRTLVESSTRVGLDNIKKRYALATAAPVEVKEANDLFTVTLPLI